MSKREAETAKAIVSLYDQNAGAWAAQRASSLQSHKWLDRLISHLPVGAQVLDVGCGTGNPIARYLLDQGCRVTGIDSSAAMIAKARKAHPAATWITADMRALSLGSRFDAILAWNSFFHLTPEDQRAMFPVFTAHATPGAPLLFTAGPNAGVAMGEMFGAPLYHASLAPKEYRQLFKTHGFVEIIYVPEDPECGGHTVWLVQKR